MEIKSITRTVSGDKFDNISVTANLLDGEDPVEKAKELDLLAKRMLEEINRQAIEKARQDSERSYAVEVLSRALEYAKEKAELPF